MKKNLQIALKIKSPDWNKQTHRQTDRLTDRLTLNFINTIDIQQDITWNTYTILNIF